MDTEEIEPCDECGELVEVSQLQETWEGYLLCPACFAIALEFEEAEPEE